jgi:hypothetical protein
MPLLMSRPASRDALTTDLTTVVTVSAILSARSVGSLALRGSSSASGGSFGWELRAAGPPAEGGWNPLKI